MIERWLEGLSGKETIGFDFNPVNRLLFRSLVEGSNIEDLLARLRTELSDSSIETHRDACSTMRRGDSHLELI